MGKRCIICNFKTMFYYWSTTKGFPISKLLNKLNNVNGYKENGIKSGRVGVPICYKCAKKIGFPPHPPKKPTIPVPSGSIPTVFKRD